MKRHGRVWQIVHPVQLLDGAYQRSGQYSVVEEVGDRRQRNVPFLGLWIIIGRKRNNH